MQLDRPTAVTVTTRFGGGGLGQTSLGVGGSTSFGSGGRTTTVTVDAAVGGTAILRFATQG